MLTFELESAEGGSVAGIDEAGRGAWAGPVYAAATVFRPFGTPAAVTELINDSKKLTPQQRRELYPSILVNAAVGIGSASVHEIEKLNILGATKVAMSRALNNLGFIPNMALIDGNQLPNLPCPTKYIIKGDTKSLSIAAASIIAKVSRDNHMINLSRTSSGYGWENNFGYGTKQHIAALKENGVTRHHRRSYKPIREMLT